MQQTKKKKKSGQSRQAQNTGTALDRFLDAAPSFLFWFVLLAIAGMYIVTRPSIVKQHAPVAPDSIPVSASPEDNTELTLKVYSDTYIMSTDTWFSPDVDKTTVETIVFDRGFPSPAPTTNSVRTTWDASENQQGGITCSLEDGVLTVYSHGADRILMGYDSSYMFSGFTNLKKIQGLEILDPKETGRMGWMFADCHSLEELRIPASWDTSLVTDMSYMLFNCHAMEHLYLDELDTDSVTTMEYMMAYCESLKELSIQNWSTGSLSQVENQTQMFMGVGENNRAIVAQLDSAEMEMWIKGERTNALKNTMWPSFGTAVLRN